MGHFMFVDHYALSGAMTTYSILETTPFKCLEVQPHYDTLIAHALHFPRHP